jgi:Fe-S-cluster containining protein
MLDDTTPTATIELMIKVADRPLHLRVTLPTGPARPRVMLPVFREVTDALVGVAEEQIASRGLAISCRKGCGACCRQLVPIAQMEAHYLLELVENMPPDRQNVIRSRFAAAKVQLDAAGLWEPLEHPERFADSELETLGVRYFAQGIACPFLEDESCSIHRDRPLACREYLVTSPAAACARPESETIDPVELPARVSKAVLHLGANDGDRFTKWVPLIVSKHWAEQNHEDPPIKTGPQMLRQVFGRLWGKPTGTPEGA